MSAPTATTVDNEKRVDTVEEGIAHHHSNRDVEMDDQKNLGYDRAGAIEAENAEHNMGVWEAVKAYPMASMWAFIMSCTIIMEAYCVFLMGNFLGIDRFARDFGFFDPVSETYVVAVKWQSAIQCSGPVGALIGCFLAGPLTTRIGYRWATITGLMLLNAFIFVFYFAKTIEVMFASQILEGIPWGIFIANAPAYCSEIVPMRLRAPCTQMLQMFWAIGAIVVGAVTYQYNEVDGEIAYRLPIALQWMFPTPLAILMFFAPESPWWLVRKGRMEEAAKSLKRLGRKDQLNTNEAVSMIKRTVDLELDQRDPSLLDLFKGINLYRTAIVCFVYAAQNLTGNLIANQAVYFFKTAGMDQNTAFAMGLITSALQTVMVMLSWILTTYLGRRTIYVWGSFINVMFLVALGIAASVPNATTLKPAQLAQASLGLIVSVGFTLGPAPASWVIIGETSSLRLRPLTTAVGRASYYIINIPCIFLASWMLNKTGANLGGKCGYVWAGTGFFCFLMAFFFLPEMKDRSYREIDILFTRKVQAMKWKKTVVDINDDE